MQYKSVGERRFLRQGRRGPTKKPSVTSFDMDHAFGRPSKSLLSSGEFASRYSGCITRRGITMLCRSEWFFELLSIQFIYEHHGGLPKIDSSSRQLDQDFGIELGGLAVAGPHFTPPPFPHGKQFHLTQQPSPTFFVSNSNYFFQLLLYPLQLRRYCENKETPKEFIKGVEVDITTPKNQPGARESEPRRHHT